jgi:hypothetical protein
MQQGKRPVLIHEWGLPAMVSILEINAEITIELTG